MPKRGSDADSRIFFDQLVSLGVSRLKATGAIRLEDRQILIPFGGRTKLIGVAHTVFKNGGSWSYPGSVSIIAQNSLRFCLFL
jgi:hypothetical protein